MFSTLLKWEKTGDNLVFQWIIHMLLLKSLNTTSQLYHDNQSFAGQFHEIINISISRNLTASTLPRDEIVIVDHLHFRKASAMTNPGQGSFVFSGC